MKKKFTAMILIAALVLPIAACSSGKSSSGSSAPAGTETLTETEAATETAAPVTEPEAPETEAPETEASEAEEFTMGTVSGNSYRNELLGIAVDFPDNWVVYNEEQLAEINGLVAGAMNDENAAEALENGSVFYNLFASGDEGINSVNIVYEDLGILNSMLMDEELYANLSLDSIVTELEAQGLKDVEGYAETVTFAGAPHAAISLSGKYYYSSDDYYDFFEEIVCIKQGRYMGDITFAALVYDNIDEIMGYFYSIED